MRHVFARRRFPSLALICVSAWLIGVIGQRSPGAEKAPGAPAANPAGALLVGVGTTDITPKLPVPLMGSMGLRLANTIESPLTAAVLALESRNGKQVADQAIFVCCDLAVLRGGIIEKVRQRAKEHLPGFDVNKLIFNATHTHSGPVVATTGAHSYAIPKDALQPPEYVEFLVGRLVDAIAEAWQSRKPGMVGWGLGHAVVAQNRRPVYADGHAQMYGKGNQPDFRGLEGYEDHGVEVLFFWDRNQTLIATAINVACPAQELEGKPAGKPAVSADYWDKVRKSLHARHGKQLVVLGWIGAAGDQSPHLIYRKEAEERMQQLRGLTRVEEVAQRIDRAWEQVYDTVRNDKHSDITFAHKIQTIALPVRVITAEEYAQAKDQVARLSKANQKGPAQWNQRVVDRYERQQTGQVKPYAMDLHVVRIGDVAITSNDFELFTDYGVQIKARSPAIQTFIIQLAGEGTYLPTERAVRDGGYSAIPQSNLVGPEGGQVLVERTLEAIGELWAK